METFICQAKDWNCAYGNQTLSIPIGERVKLIDSTHIAGIRFLAFQEYGKDNWFMANGFKSLKGLH